jgi:hypothetical protein
VGQREDGREEVAGGSERGGMRSGWGPDVGMSGNVCRARLFSKEKKNISKGKEIFSKGNQRALQMMRGR